ncbi:ABC transporter substrate-binding protein [Roseomonas sp. CCTCC AB2023176]|uniref:ABC transporter substrate-binding protein n=1 Tax=Roseomonas sp. CCTCC AB2023176 TaxID=3342640 RepID=UPI0035E1E8A5
MTLSRRAALGTLAAAALARPALAQGDARVLRYVPPADVTILDPLNTTAYPTRTHGHLCWDTLYGLDEAFRPQPQLAEGQVVEDDGRRWTFTLREGPTFHDGEPVRARDAVASIRRWMARDTHGQTLAPRVEEMRALDDRRFEIRLNRPFGPMLDAMAKASSYPCFVYPERFAATDPNRAFTEVVGSGPYRFVADERVSGARLVYRRYDAYRPAPGTPSMTAGPKIAHFERMEWRILPDAGTVAAALQAGEVDWWEQISPDLRPVLQRNRNVVVERIDSTGLMAFLRPNHLHPPFDDPAVRRALWPALPQADVMQSMLGPDRDRWSDGIGLFPKGSPLENDEGIAAVAAPRDIEAARRAVAATGKAGAKVLVLHPTDVNNNNAMTLVVTDFLKKVGFDAESVTSDWGTVLARRTRREAPAQGGWNAVVAVFAGMEMATPAGNLLLRGNGDAAWFGWPRAAELERLRDEWFDAPTMDAQRGVARRLQAQFFQDVPYWPLGQFNIDGAYRRGLTGIRKGMSLPLNVRWG